MARVARWRTGFTLVELMVVVIMLGILAAIAVPAYTRYVKRSKSAEAHGNLSKIYLGEVTYFLLNLDRGSVGYVNAGANPPSPPGANKYPGNVALWSTNSQWTSIGFALDAGHYYQYSSRGSVTGFTAQAFGNLDGDANYSTFQRVGILNSGETQGARVEILSEFD